MCQYMYKQYKMSTKQNAPSKRFQEYSDFSKIYKSVYM